jgi:hypothetical protein
VRYKARRLAYDLRWSVRDVPPITWEEARTVLREMSYEVSAAEREICRRRAEDSGDQHHSMRDRPSGPSGILGDSARGWWSRPPSIPSAASRNDGSQSRSRSRSPEEEGQRTAEWVRAASACKIATEEEEEDLTAGGRCWGGAVTVKVCRLGLGFRVLGFRVQGLGFRVAHRFVCCGVR